MITLADGTNRMSALATALLFASGALAQVGGGPAVPTPNQLPLSGRAAQNGSVTATESPVPGTTTSVNTINPTLQVSGSFGGSVGSPATLPFSGRLSLREAVERGARIQSGRGRHGAGGAAVSRTATGSTQFVASER